MGFAVVLGRAGVRRLAAAVVRLAVLAALAAAGFAVRDRLAADDDLDEAVEALAVLALDPPVLDPLVLDPLAVVRRVVVDLAAGWPAVGLAEDMALAASVRDLLAVVIALVAAFIACMAVDIVLADDVAFVAAAVILVAAAPTLVAADETVRAAVAGVFVVLDADVLRAELLGLLLLDVAVLDVVVLDPARDVPRDAALRVVLAAVARV